jgi:hypothetical protein
LNFSVRTCGTERSCRVFVGLDEESEMSDNNHDEPLIGRDERNRPDAGQNAGAPRFGDESLGEEGSALGRQDIQGDLENDDADTAMDGLLDEDMDDADGAALSQESSSATTPSQAEGERGASDVESEQDDDAFET